MKGNNGGDQQADVLDELTEEQRGLLERYHFDEGTWRELRRALLAGELSEASNRVQGEVGLPREEDIRQLPGADSEEGQRLARLGRQALEAGEMGIVVLNGGMATRFGGVVKGTVEVTEGLSFLALKLKDAARFSVPVLLMNSFATHDKTMAHLEEHDLFGADRDQVIAFGQNISARLTPQGRLFREEDGEVSLYAPGHGDLPSAIGRGALQRFREQGGRYLLMSNVDNLLASLDPVVLGAHIDASRTRGVQMTVESAPRYEGDKGGMPAMVDGHLQVVEAFRFPQGFDSSTIPVFNTNTFLFDAEALERDFDLTWFVVTKQVDGRDAIQFERLAGELSAFLDTQFLAVPREGTESRFLPIKRPEDLDEARGYLREVMEARGIL